MEQANKHQMPFSSSGNKGYTNVILLPLIASFVCGALFMAGDFVNNLDSF